MYLGLATGLVVFFVSLTGALWAFNEELSALFTPTEEEIPISNAPLISLTRAKEIALSVFPDKTVHGVEFSQEPNKAIEVIFYQSKPTPFYSTVALHPYTGEILHVEDHKKGFFAFVMRGHRFLWLPQAIGSQIVGWSTFIFLFMLITGVILWWPKNKKATRQRFLFNWKSTTKWRRKNFDLHSIVGFYASLFLFLIVLTGSVMAFRWMGYLVYKGVGGAKDTFFMIPNNNSGSVQKSAMDDLILLVKDKYPTAESFEIHFPAADTTSLYVEISFDNSVHYNNDYRFYDQQTLEEIPVNTLYGAYENTDASDKFSRMNYDIHVGSILGFPGKLIACLLSLISASLPITGFMVWWGRKKKKKTIQTK